MIQEGIVKRPTPREIDNRLKDAKDAIKNRCTIFANPSKVVGELMSLEIGETDEIWELILQFLNEIHPDDYAGTHPPQKSYEHSISNCDLWAFSWYSSLLKKKMYLKFSIKEGMFYYVSLHKCKYSKE